MTRIPSMRSLSFPRAAVVGALAYAAAPLNAQRTLLPVATLPDGTAVSVDSASVWRTGDSTVVATAVYRLPAGTTGPAGADRREENVELDCARGRRGARRIVLFQGDQAVQTATEASSPTVWVSVPEAELPVQRGICGVLLGARAAALTRTYEIDKVERMPELANVREIQSAIPREFPAEQRDAGIGGMAVVRALVRPDGRVDAESLRVTSASLGVFGDAAVRVVQRMRFHPARVHGRPVAVWVTIPTTFDFR